LLIITRVIGPIENFIGPIFALDQILAIARGITLVEASKKIGIGMKSILDPSFKYVPSVKTDIRKTFARIRRQRASQYVEAQAKACDDGRASLRLVQRRA
jgi:hypothetical protein